jgi:hypothetical protein
MEGIRTESEKKTAEDAIVQVIATLYGKIRFLLPIGIIALYL